MKEIVKKLVHALEDKATTDLLTGNQTFNSNFGYTGNKEMQLNSPIGKLNSLSGRKSSQPPSKQYDALKLKTFDDRPTKLPAIAPADPPPSEMGTFMHGSLDLQ